MPSAHCPSGPFRLDFGFSAVSKPERPAWLRSSEQGVSGGGGSPFISPPTLSLKTREPRVSCRDAGCLRHGVHPTALETRIWAQGVLTAAGVSLSKRNLNSKLARSSS